MKKIAVNFFKLSLAVLVNLLLGTAAVRAQSAEAKVIPPPPPPPLAQPSPLPAKLIEDQTAPAGWQRYQIGEDEGFSLILPGPPEATAKTFDSATDKAATVRAYMSPADTGGYGAIYIDTPRTFDGSVEANRLDSFTKFVNGFANGLQESARTQGLTYELKMLEQRKTTAGGLAGYEQDFSFGPLAGRVRLVFAGRHAYGMTGFWNALVSAGERNTFFESFRLNRKR